MADLEVEESYSVLGQQRFVVRVKDTNIKFNVEASSAKEALRKVRKILNNQ